VDRLVGRWPTPADLAEAPTDEILRAWANLGYPRRALRLRDCAPPIVDGVIDGRGARHGPDLLALPGIGDYTARAVAAFAFGRAVPVVDTNVRRVQRRLARGEFLQGPAKAGDLADVADLMPWVDDDPGCSSAVTAIRGTVRAAIDREALGMCASLMELGATVCTARSPQCGDLPGVRPLPVVALGRPAPSAAGVGRGEETGPEVRGHRPSGARADHGDPARRGAPPRSPSTTITGTSEDAGSAGPRTDSLVADGLVDAAGRRVPTARYRLPR
jgi:A/G-specific adenine glycosylase